MFFAADCHVADGAVFNRAAAVTEQSRTVTRRFVNGEVADCVSTAVKRAAKRFFVAVVDMIAYWRPIAAEVYVGGEHEKFFREVVAAVDGVSKLFEVVGRVDFVRIGFGAVVAEDNLRYKVSPPKNFCAIITQKTCAEVVRRVFSCRRSVVA